MYVIDEFVLEMVRFVDVPRARGMRRQMSVKGKNIGETQGGTHRNITLGSITEIERFIPALSECERRLRASMNDLERHDATECR